MVGKWDKICRDEIVYQTPPESEQPVQIKTDGSEMFGIKFEAKPGEVKNVSSDKWFVTFKV